MTRPVPSPSSAIISLAALSRGADDAATYWLRAGAVTGLCTIAIQELSDFTLQMPGAAVLFVVLAAIAIHRPSHGARDSPVAAASR